MGEGLPDMVTPARSRRPPTLRGRRRALIVAALAAVAAGCDSTPPSPPAPATGAVSVAPPTDTPVAAPTLQPIELRQLRLCATECAVTGSIAFQHPAWGPAWLMTLKTGGAELNDPAESYETSLIVVDADRRIRWRWTGGDWFELRPSEPPTDDTGHLFVHYNPGRYDGVLILAPTPSGFEDFGSLPGKDDLPTSKFYGGRTVDRDGDGTFEIRVELNNCTPTCAEGEYVTEFFGWNGSDYVPQ